MTRLRVDNLNINKQGKPLVQNVSFVLEPGELVIMLGPNGAGKSLTLHHAIGITPPTSGTVTLGGVDIQALSPVARARQLSYLPQTRPLAWPARVDDLVALGRFAHGARLGKLGPEDQAAVTNAINACDIAHLAMRNANTLSGGELARVHCARAFAANAPLLIADEPVAALDPHHQFGIMDLFKDFTRQGGGALIVLHDIGLAAKYADRLIWMKDGQIRADGSPDATLTAERLAEVYRIKARIEGTNILVDGTL